jgi:transposase
VVDRVALQPCGDGGDRVYLKPVWNILSEGNFELILANAAHIKNVPGRKTDVNDATWIADLVACGLIKASFVPEEEIQDLRSLLRARKQLTREQTRHTQRIQKTLEEANIKLDSVISDIMGISGRKMIEAMIEGTRNPSRLAALADRRLKASPKQLYDALHGRLTDHHRFMLKLYLSQYDALDKAIKEIDQQVNAANAQMDAEVEAGHATFRSLISLLSTMPGVSVLSATTILSEIGTDMSHFETAGKLVAWAGLCPGQNESAGKRKSSRLRKGAPWLKTMLVQCAWSAAKKKHSYTKPNSTGYGLAVERRRPSAPWPPPCSQLSIICSRMASNTTISEWITSTAEPPTSKLSGSSRS